MVGLILFNFHLVFFTFYDIMEENLRGWSRKGCVVKMSRKDQSLLYNHNFMLLFIGGMVSRIGSSIHYIALIWLVLDLTGKGGSAGLILVLATLPGVILGPLAGVMVDRIHRKVIIVGMDLIRGFVVLYLSFIVYTGRVSLFYLGLTTVIIAISSTFFNPAITATIPNLVARRKLQQANSFEYFSLNFTQIIGYALGGILIAITGVYGVFLINGISYLISAISELFIQIPKTKKEGEGVSTLLEDFKFGAKFLFQNKGLFSLFNLSIIINFLFSGIMAVGLPFVFKEVLLVDSNYFGLAQSIFPLGAIIGAIIMGFQKGINNYFRLLSITIVIQTILLFLLGIPILPGFLRATSMMNSYWLLLIFLLIFGLVNAICNVPISVLLQSMVPDGFRGRVFGLIGTLNQGLVPISMALVGYLLDSISTSYLFFMASTAMVFVILFGFRIPALKTLNAPT